MLAAALGAGAASGGPAGELDGTFGDNGIVTIGAGISAAAVAQQPADGKLLVAGTYPGSDGWSDFAVLRFNPDGSLDGTFGTNGVVTIDFAGPGDTATALVLQGDGSIVVAGMAYPATDGGPRRFAFARLEGNGVLDSSYGEGGRAVIDLEGQAGYLAAIAPLADGRLIAFGADDNSDLVFFRLNASGELDTSFGTGGIPGTTMVDTSLGDGPSAPDWEDGPSALLRQADGKYVACGTRFEDWGPPMVTQMMAVRVNADGSLDGGFGTGGVWHLESGAQYVPSGASDCLSLPDGSLVLAGSTAGAALVRVRSDGALDTAYWDSGVAKLEIGDYASVQSIVLLADGAFGVAGTVTSGLARRPGGYNDSVSDVFFARVDPVTGLPDPDFGHNGVTIVDFGSLDLAPHARGGKLIQQADGRLVYAGSIGFSGPSDIQYSDRFTDADYDRLTAIGLARVDPAGAGNPGFAGVAVAFQTVAENVGSATVKVRRTGGGTGPLVVDYETLAMTASASADFAAASGTLAWLDGDMEPKTISIPIVDDNIPEQAERFLVGLSNSSAGLAGAYATIWIDASDDAPTTTSGGTPVVTGGGDGGGGGALGIETLLLLAGYAFLCVGRSRRNAERLTAVPGQL